MSWHSVWPDGAVSVKSNETKGTDNTSYVEVKQKLDHYWNENASNDGHHRYVEMPDTTASGRAIDANKDPSALSAGQTCLLYTRKKTPVESPGAQYDEPYAYTVGNSVNQYMQLGFRALGHFTIAAGVLTQTYAHNCVITRTSEGLFTVTFTKDLPSDNYSVTCDAIRNNASAKQHGNFSIQAATVKGTVMTDKFCKLVFTRNTANDLEDPVAGWVAIMGG